MNEFSDTLNGVMDDYNIDPVEDFERDILGTTPEDDWFDEADENTCDMNALSPAFRELYDEYADDEDDEDDDIL